MSNLGPQPDPYAAPRAPLETEPAPSLQPPGRHPGTLLGIAVGLIPVTFALAAVTRSGLVFVVGHVASMAVACWGIFKTVRRAIQPGGQGFAGGVLITLGNLLVLGWGALLALFMVSGGRGRQLRRLGRVLLPPVRPGGVWASAAFEVAVPAAARAGLARQWRENGRTEHASVAAFARLTLDLMALGAPPALIDAANRDARDEIRHAELCFSLARALDGANEGPGPFPEPQRARTLPRLRALALAKLAVESLIDGALHEGVSARTIAALVRRCPEPAIGAMLKELAADEGRHAAHGWDVVEWCLSEGGPTVAQALRGALARLQSDPRSTLPEAARDGSWERWGIPGQALEAEQFAEARGHIVRRVNDIVAQVGQ